jgi:hypothetical protein
MKRLKERFAMGTRVTGRPKALKRFEIEDNGTIGENLAYGVSDLPVPSQIARRGRKNPSHMIEAEDISRGKQAWSLP